MQRQDGHIVNIYTKLINRKMKRKDYMKPTMKIVKLQHQVHLMQFSRDGYRGGGSGFGGSGVGGRSGYDDGGDGFDGGGFGGGSGYGDGGSGFGGSGIGGRSGYGSGGDGFY